MLQITNPLHRKAETDAWISVYNSTSLLSLGTLAFFYALVLFSVLGLAGRELNLALFVTCVMVLPPVCAAVKTYLLRPSLARWSSLAESINTWTVVLGLIALTIVSLIKLVLAAGPAFWTKSASAVVLVTLAIHVFAITSLLWWQLGSAGRRQAARSATEFARLRTLQLCTFAAVFFMSVVALFRIE